MGYILTVTVEVEKMLGIQKSLFIANKDWREKYTEYIGVNLAMDSGQVVAEASGWRKQFLQGKCNK